jgi:hypothetical protein
MPTANPEPVWRIRPKVFVGNQNSDTCIHKVFARRLFMQNLKSNLKLQARRSHYVKVNLLEWRRIN